LIAARAFGFIGGEWHQNGQQVMIAICMHFDAQVISFR